MATIDQVGEILQLGKHQLDELAVASYGALNRVQDDVSRRIGLGAGMMYESLRSSATLLEARTPNAVLEWQTSFLQLGIQFGLEAGRAEISKGLQAQQAIARSARDQAIRASRQFQDLVERLSASLPSEAQSLTEAFRAMLGTTILAFETYEPNVREQSANEEA